MLLAETREWGQLQHSPAPWQGLAVLVVITSSYSQPKADTCTQTRHFLVALLKPKGMCRQDISHYLSEAIELVLPTIISNALLRPEGTFNPHRGYSSITWLWWPRELAFQSSIDYNK